MPKTLQVKEFAFEFSGSVRVFSAVTKFYIDAHTKRDSWEYSNNRIAWNTRSVRLQFAAWVDDQKQLSGAATTFSQLSNAIEDSTETVYFYPRHRDGAGVLHDTAADKYEIGPAWDKIRIFDADKVGISTAAKRIDIIQVDTLQALPAWASR